MKKQLLTLLLSGLTLSGFAQVTPATGAVEPQPSTAEEPVWYAMMTSHLDAAARQNRWMYYDGETLGTTQFTADGLGADADQTQYAWRLEEYNDGSSDGVRLIHYSGKEVMIPPTAEGVANTQLQMYDGVGSLWTLMLASETGQANCAENQYVLTYPHATMSQYLFLNAMDGSGTGASKLPWGITVYNQGAHQASGWFFVPLDLDVEEPEPEQEWVELYVDTVGANSRNGYNWDMAADPYYSSGDWTKLSSSASALLQLVQSSNNYRFGPSIKSFSAGDAFAVRVDLEPGIYKFSYLHKADKSGVTAKLAYGTEFNTNLTDASEEVDVPQKGGNDAGDPIESSDVVIAEAGSYYFHYVLTSSGSQRVRIGDFYLYKLDVPQATTYQVTWAQPENGELAVLDGQTELTSPAQVEEGTELTITATPAEGYQLEAITVAGEPLEGNTWTVDGDAAIAATFTLAPVDPNTAIQMFGATASGKEPNHNRFSFDDDLLGSHVNGSRENDQRSYSFTMSAWVKVNEARGRVMGYGQKGWWGPGPTFNLYIENDTYHLYNRQRATDGSVNDGQDESTGQAVETGEWAFLTVVFDEEAGTRTFYYNGEQKFTGNYTQEGLGLLQDEAEFYIIDGLNEGNANYTNDPALDLDEVQVWTKALTADEVAASMNEVDPSADGLAYLYRFGAERMNDDFTFNNLATSAAVTSQVTGAYMTGTIEYSAAVWTSVLSGSVVEPTFVPGRKATPTPEPEMFTITWDEVEGVTFDAYDWNNQETHYNSGDQVEEGTQVVLTATANEGWVLDGMTVNGEEFNQSLVAMLGGQNPVTVTENLVVSATAHQVVTYAITFSVENPELGELHVVNAFTGEELTSGDAVEEGTMLEINMFPEANVTSEVYINDELITTITSDEVDPDYGGCWYNVEAVTEDLDILVKFVAETVEPEQYTVTWEGDNCTFEVYTSGLKWVSNGQLVDAGTEIFIDVTPADGFTLESLTVNGVEFEEGGLYVVNSDTHIVATAVGTGINAVAVNGAYYDAAAEMLYVDGEQALKVYDVTGRMVVDTDVDGTFSMAGFKDGIYMAVVDGKVLKFRK